MTPLTRAAWLEIDLDKLVRNYHVIKEKMNPGVELMAIVKADAYAHGSRHIAEALMAEGVRRFGVAHLSEALYLKKYLPDAYVLILGYTPDHLLEKAIRGGMVLSIFTRQQAALCSEIAGRLGAACHIHVKLETGMNRQGFLPTAENADAIAEISRMPGLVVDGLYTHFPASDDDPAYTANQVRLFDGMVEMLGERGVKIPIRHVSNSAAVMNFPEYGYDMVRAGIILYGVYPFPGADRSFIVLESIESLKAQITYLKVVPPGEKVGYGLSYQTTRETQIATVPIGYADGYSRSLNNIGQCIVQGTVVPIIGKLCMDQLMLDVTGLTPKVGDEVVFMGRQGDVEITIEDIAGKIGQIPASVMCSFTKRLPRVYTRGGEICHVLDYLLEL